MFETATLQTYLDEVFPQMRGAGLTLEDVGAMTARARLDVTGTDGHSRLRPGGTVSGPALAALADCAFYAALLGMIGREPLAVTVTLSVTFLRKPAAAADLIGVARLSKLGRRLAMGDVTMTSEGAVEPAATAHLVYALPGR